MSTTQMWELRLKEESKDGDWEERRAKGSVREQRHGGAACSLWIPHKTGVWSFSTHKNPSNLAPPTNPPAPPTSPSHQPTSPTHQLRPPACQSHPPATPTQPTSPAHQPTSPLAPAHQSSPPAHQSISPLVIPAGWQFRIFRSTSGPVGPDSPAWFLLVLQGLAERGQRVSEFSWAS